MRLNPHTNALQLSQSVDDSEVDSCSQLVVHIKKNLKYKIRNCAPYVTRSENKLNIVHSVLFTIL